MFYYDHLSDSWGEEQPIRPQSFCRSSSSAHTSSQVSGVRLFTLRGCEEVGPQLASHASWLEGGGTPPGVLKVWPLFTPPWPPDPGASTPIWCCVIGSMTKRTDAEPLLSGRAVWGFWRPKNAVFLQQRLVCRTRLIIQSCAFKDLPG